MNNKLSVKNINVKNGEGLALKSINLDLYKGEFVVLLGSSGAGKSTLLRKINQKINLIYQGISELSHAINFPVDAGT